MSPFPACHVSDIPPGGKKIVEVEGRSIGIYNIGGQFYAIRNLCPHQGADLCRGITTALIVASEPNHYEFEREGEIVRCPWHQWEFDIKTGHMIIDPSVRTKSYPVTVETYEVSIEDSKVILHL